MSSPGITAYEFVKQVYYMQEKVLLDFWPTDDKYKEVLTEANLILQELQNVEDWTWLRETYALGSCETEDHKIPSFTLPSTIYKPSTLYHDCVYLVHPDDFLLNADGIDWSTLNHGDPQPLMTHIPLQPWWWPKCFIRVPIASAGDNKYRTEHGITGFGQIHVPDIGLRAVRIGDQLTFNRRFTWYERKLIAIVDIQRRIEQFHICDSSCTFTEINGEGSRPVCNSEIEDGEEITHLNKIPDPNYVIMATAARHAEGSPPALARVAGLQDAAQRILSAMRQNDASATEPDWQDWEIPGYIEVI